MFKCVKNNLDALYIPYAYWEWDATFSIFNGYPSLANLPLCMQNAFDIIASPLPVELVYFGGYNEEENNFLQWTTASEVNNYYFEVERSLDLKTFNKIGKIPGSGTTSFQHTYAFTDINAPAETRTTTYKIGHHGRRLDDAALYLCRRFDDGARRWNEGQYDGHRLHRRRSAAHGAQTGR